jgi:hypothetical protein
MNICKKTGLMTSESEYILAPVITINNYPSTTNNDSTLCLVSPDRSTAIDRPFHDSIRLWMRTYRNFVAIRILPTIS